ncbi:MAG: antA/AntB antirepressor family protein [Leuconostoc pseudomesenteroides]|uniref:antA/AntB antirepressor family protein n=1 Tax=Leuconostoc pseudomesenteroides TaxID=33968 RepID=UPI0039EA477E
MNQEIIKVEQNDQGEQRVSARELYKELEVKKRFSVWFEMNSKQLIEFEDYRGVLSGTQQNQYGGVKQIQDYSLTVDAAKEIALMSGTEKGKQIRKYFIQVEKEYRKMETLRLQQSPIAELIRKVDVLLDNQTINSEQENVLKSLRRERAAFILRTPERYKNNSQLLLKPMSHDLFIAFGITKLSQLKTKDFQMARGFLAYWEPNDIIAAKIGYQSAKIASKGIALYNSVG